MLVFFWVLFEFWIMFWKFLRVVSVILVDLFNVVDLMNFKRSVYVCGNLLRFVKIWCWLLNMCVMLFSVRICVFVYCFFVVLCEWWMRILFFELIVLFGGGILVVDVDMVLICFSKGNSI